MRKNRYRTLLAIFPVCGLLLAGCDNNVPEVNSIGVQSVTLNEEALDEEEGLMTAEGGGFQMEIGSEADIANKVALVPYNATDRAQTFYSADNTIAEVDAYGKLTAKGLGTTTISIYVGSDNVHADFTLTVVSVFPVDATDILLKRAKFYMMVNGKYNVASDVTLIPDKANDELEFVSESPSVATVDANGMVTGNELGKTRIKISSQRQPGLEPEYMEVIVTELVGYHLRNAAEGAAATWTMTASQNPLPTDVDAKNAITAALDADTGTSFALVRPGKNSGGVNLTGQAGTVELWFVVDMKASRLVNSFNIVHRAGGSVIQTRWWGFDTIYGSNDDTGTEAERVYTPIVNNVVLPSTVSDISVLNSTVLFDNDIPYRYIKFYAKTANCFYQNGYTTAGNTAQIQELYLGVSNL